MIPSKDTAHLVQDPTGNWTVVGKPKPAEGVPPPPLNNKLPDDKPQPPVAPAPLAAAPKPGSSPEVPVRVVPTPLGGLPFNGAVTLPPGALTVPPGTVLPPSAQALPGVSPIPGALLSAPLPAAQPGALAVPAQAPAAVLPPVPADTAPPALTTDVAPAAPVAPAGIGQ
jgi:hypothetical protein